MFYESLIILNISTLNFSEGVPASVVMPSKNKLPLIIRDIIIENQMENAWGNVLGG